MNVPISGKEQEVNRIGKGVTPDPKVLGYITKLPDGNILFSRVLAYEIDPRGHHRSWVHHPRFGVEVMTPKEGRLEVATPLVAVTTEDVPALIESIIGQVSSKYEARIAEMEKRLDDQSVMIARLAGDLLAFKAQPAPVPPMVASTKGKGKTNPAPLGPSESQTAPHTDAAPADAPAVEVKGDLDFLDE